MCPAVADQYLESEIKSHVCNVFSDFLRNGKAPSTVMYLMYKVRQDCGLIEHQDVDATFVSCLIMIDDSSDGCLHIPGADLPEIFDAVDVVFLDPRVLHSVSIYQHKES